LQTGPRHRASIAWLRPPTAGSVIRGAIFRTGGQIYDSRGVEAIQRRTAGYTLVDAGFIQTQAGRYELAFDVSNLFDQLYDQAYALPREGRAAVVTLRARMR
jgi:outer membrane receptor protein involved in Fe transport